MRILHISTRLILGGSQENTVLSCEGQARLGHDVHLAFGPIFGPEGSLLDRVEKFRTGTSNAARIHTHVIPDLVRQISPLADRRALRQLDDLITSIKPDVVHTHSSKAGILGRLAAWNVRNRSPAPRRPAIVHTIHGPPFMPIEGSPASRLKIRALNLAYTLAERHAAYRCDAIVAVADAMTAQFLARGIGAPAQYTTVYSGMDTAAFLQPTLGQDRPRIRRKLGLREHDIVVGTVARLAQHKGHDDLLDALAETLRSRPNLRLLWVGDGWWRERLVTKARALGLAVAQFDAPLDAQFDEQVESDRDPVTHADQPAQLILTGLVPPDRVPGLIRAMDVLAHPSSREGLPRTVPQALLCGVCPVAYDCDGTREVCINHQTGLLVPVGNVPALRDAVLSLIDHPDQRTTLATQGQALCTDRFAAHRMVEELEKVYTRALERCNI